MYLRLSKDDMEEGECEVETTALQIRELLRSFVKKPAGYSESLIYMWMTDTQENFGRPEFKRMTTDIEAGKVNCVIVKDLSRFGREYIEAGRWIERTYPKDFKCARLFQLQTSLTVKQQIFREVICSSNQKFCK